MTDIERVILVDEQDQELGSEEKLRAHQLGLLHRAFSVLVFRKQVTHLEVLLQQRHPDKYHCGGLWTNTCCSHPRPGETILQAGARRLWEEMQVDSPLTVAGRFLYKASLDNDLIEHELDYVLIGYSKTDKINFNTDEVQDYAWVDVDELAQDLSNNSVRYTPWFKQALEVALRGGATEPQPLGRGQQQQAR
jgi:isopentenyl-diphosphate delta-isomerase type 1